MYLPNPATNNNSILLYCNWNSNNFFFFLQAFLFYDQKYIPAIKFVAKTATPKGL